MSRVGIKLSKHGVQVSGRTPSATKSLSSAGKVAAVSQEQQQQQKQLQQQRAGQGDLVDGGQMYWYQEPFLLITLCFSGFVAACVLLIMGWLTSAVLSQKSFLQGGKRTVVYAEEEARLVTGDGRSFGGIEQGSDV